MPSRLLLHTLYTEIHKSLSTLKGHHLLILLHTRFNFDALICMGNLKFINTDDDLVRSKGLPANKGVQ